LYSMTGYGRAYFTEEGREFTVEVKSVNHRYLDLNMRMGRNLSFLEDDVRRIIKMRMSRGHVDVYLTYRNTREDSKDVQLDKPLLGSYIKAFREAEYCGLNNDLALSSALRFGDVLTIQEAEDDQQAIKDLLEQGLNAALDMLLSMRLQEGQKLGKDIRFRIEAMGGMLSEIEAKAPEVVEVYREKLNKRIAELMQGSELDESRLSMEVALFADKCNIDEEIVRLKSHMDQFLNALQSTEPTGRKLDFIVQEMNREVNTIGSKASDVGIVNNVLSLKTEIEKIREQVQNIE
jgi:uncharacterized protein (TIGR00255 family)